jgi:hypothetical protein
MPKYTMDFLISIRKRLNNLNKDFLQDYAVEVDAFNDVPLLEQMRYIAEMGNGAESLELKEKVAKISVVGHAVTVSYKGQKIGSFTVNDLSNRFDDHEILRKHPAAYSLLLEVCSRKIVEKYLPPRAESDPPAAAAGNGTQGSQRQSAERSGVS